MNRDSEGNLGLTEGLRDLQAALDQLFTLYLRCQLYELMRLQIPRRIDKKLHDQLVTRAKESCGGKETVLRWLTDRSGSADFSGLVDTFHFLKGKIEAEEKKDHGDQVHIVFVAHGAIRDALMPACCLLPLDSVADVLLYSPWNCATSAEVTYGIATGRIKPSHRVFYRRPKGTSEVPWERFSPPKLPDGWNSMRKAGEQMIPNITVSPLRPTDGVWGRYKQLENQHGAPGKGRIVIPFMGPGATGSVPFPVVSLALALVLQASRFTATVHLNACLRDQSEGQRFDPEYLQKQYACMDNDTIMMVLEEALKEPWLERFCRRLFA